MKGISERTIERLSLYRRILVQLASEHTETVCSHNLATLARGTPAQVRRDLMAVGCSGRPSQGYDVAELTDGIGQFLDAPEAQAVALVGVGNLGRAILAYLANRRPKLTINAAFDNDPGKIGREIEGCGCRCFSIDQMPDIVRSRGIRVAIIAVPASVAQSVADQLVSAGIAALVNFAPVRLQTPEGVFAEDIDIGTALEKAAFFACIDK